jgi:hypothetical protein
MKEIKREMVGVVGDTVIGNLRILFDERFDEPTTRHQIRYESIDRVRRDWMRIRWCGGRRECGVSLGWNMTWFEGVFGLVRYLYIKKYFRTIKSSF